MTHLTLIKNGKEKRIDLARTPGLSVPYGKLIAWIPETRFKTGIEHELYFWKLFPSELLKIQHFHMGDMYEKFWRENDAVITDEALFLEACGNYRIGGPRPKES